MASIGAIAPQDTYRDPGTTNPPTNPGLNAAQFAAVVATGKLNKLRIAMEAAARGNAYDSAPWGPAPTWQASFNYTYTYNTIVRGAAVGSTANLYALVGSTAAVNATTGTSAATGGPTGTGPGLITDGTIVWQYIGPATSTGTYPLISSVTPTVSTDVMTGYLSVINSGDLTALGLTNVRSGNTPSAPLFKVCGTPLSDAITPIPKNGGTLAAPSRNDSSNRMFAKTRTNARKWIAFVSIGPWNTTLGLSAIKVNGRLLSEAVSPAFQTAAVNPGSLLLDLTKFGAGDKVIEFFCQQTLAYPFYYIAVGPDDYVIPYEKDLDYKIAIEGDSIGNGSYISGADTASTLPFALTETLGVEGVYNNCIGGTGLIATSGGTATTYLQRLPDIVAYRPDMLIVWGDHNDDGATSVQRKAAWATYWAEVRRTMPNVSVVCVAGTQLQGEYANQLVVEQDAVAAFNTFFAGDANALLIPIFTASPPLLSTTGANGYFFQSGAAPYGDGHPISWYYRHMVGVVRNAIGKWIASKGVV